MASLCNMVSSGKGLSRKKHVRPRTKTKESCWTEYGSDIPKTEEKNKSRVDWKNRAKKETLRYDMVAAPLEPDQTEQH